MKVLDYFYEEYILNAIDWLIEFGESFVRCIYNVILLVTIPIWILPYKLSKKNNKAVNK